MPKHAPATRLATHEVTNQPGELTGRNLFASDPALREAALREGGDWLHLALMRLGEDAGSEHVLELGEAANRHPPELVNFDRFGRRLDEVRFHSAYHELMTLAMEHRIHPRIAPDGERNPIHLMRLKEKFGNRSNARRAPGARHCRAHRPVASAGTTRTPRSGRGVGLLRWHANRKGWRASFGALPAGLDIPGVLSRQMDATATA